MADQSGTTATTQQNDVSEPTNESQNVITDSDSIAGARDQWETYHQKMDENYQRSDSYEDSYYNFSERETADDSNTDDIGLGELLV